MVKPIVTSILAAERPYELAEFYAFAMDAEIKPGFNKTHFLVVNSFGFKIQIYKPSINKVTHLKGSALSICLQGPPSSSPKDDLQKWILKLVSEGAEVKDEPALKAFGAEVWISDPEGNVFVLVVPLMDASDQ